MNNEKKFYVYEWYIVETGEVFYVGKGTRNRYKTITNRNKFFRDMYHSHNCDVRIIACDLSEEEAFVKEIETIKHYRENTSYRLTNQTDGGEGTSGWIPTDEFREKQSKIHKSQWEDEKFREKVLAIRRDENGVYKSQEFRNKISSIVRGESNPNYNHHWSDAQKESLRQKQKSNPLYYGSSNPNAKKIICIETGEVFNCTSDAKQKYRIRSDGSLTVALKNPIRTAAGLHWVIYSEEFLDEIYRFNYLVEVLKLNPNQKSLICLDDFELYASKVVLAKKLDITVKKIT